MILSRTSIADVLNCTVSPPCNKIRFKMLRFHALHDSRRYTIDRQYRNAGPLTPRHKCTVSGDEIGYAPVTTTASQPAREGLGPAGAADCST